VVVSLFGRKEAAEEKAIEISVFCKIWQEDGVFNAVANDLPIAVFGKTYEEAQKHLGEAIIGHLEALLELHQLDQTIKHLRECAKESMTFEEFPRHESLYRFSAAVHDSHILALV
jgi:predicted RNase H-like HicB family nuclease